MESWIKKAANQKLSGRVVVALSVSLGENGTLYYMYPAMQGRRKLTRATAHDASTYMQEIISL